MRIPNEKEERSRLYSEYYLKSPGWIRACRERKEKDNNRCCLCGNIANLVVHHLSYENMDWENPGSEDIEHDLITLCKNCHEQFHAAKDELEEFYKDLEEKFLIECKLKLENEFESLYIKFFEKAIEVNKKYESRKIPEAKYGAKSKLRCNLIDCLGYTLSKSLHSISLPVADVGRSFKKQKPEVQTNENHKAFILDRIKEIK